MPGGTGSRRLAHAGVAAFRTYAVQAACVQHCARASAGTKQANGCKRPEASGSMRNIIIFLPRDVRINRSTASVCGQIGPPRLLNSLSKGV
jgi:hypothetical protein